MGRAVSGRSSSVTGPTRLRVAPEMATSGNSSIGPDGLTRLSLQTNGVENSH